MSGWRWPARLPRRPLAWGLVVALTALAVVGISRLRIDDDLRSLIRDGSEGFALVDEVASVFGPPDRDCILRVTARSGDIFAAGTLEALELLADRLAGVEGVEKVRSIFDARREGAAGAVLPIIPRTAEPLDAARRAEARERALVHPLVAGQLLSSDGGSALLLVRLREGFDGGGRLGPTVAAVEQVIAAEAGGPLAVELTGIPALRQQATQALRRDMILFNSLGLSLAVILSASVARSLRSTIVACLPPFVGAVWAMGVLGLCGAPVNVLTSVVPSLALVVGTCDSIHFIEDMRRSVRRGLDPVAASAGAVRRVGTACGLTSIVTAIGFASLAVAKIDVVRTFGIAAAVGALASFAAVTLLAPLLASTPFLSGLHLGRSSRLAGRLAGRLAAFSVRHARPLAAAACLGTLVLATVGGALEADNRVADSLPKDAPAALALARVDEQFGGVMGIDVVVRWPDGVDWRSAEVVAALAQVADAITSEARVSRPISLASVAGDLPDRARLRLPAEPFADLVSPADRMAVVRARISDLGSRVLEGIYDRIDERLATLAAARPGWSFDLSGMSVVSARNIRQLVRDLGSSLLLEVTVIGCILALAFRSPLAGLVSLVPNVFPLAVIAALLVLSGRGLDPASVIVFNVCLGLAVDDTVHVLAALSRQRREGVSIGTAIRRAVAETGNAVVIGGVVLSVGFAAVMASSVPVLAGFGMLACAAVAAATLAELVFLPALLVVTDGLVKPRRARVRDGIFGPTPVAWQPASEAA
ncbi:MAG: efflux RND transporter permease subunit [Planctomycetota bacterium]